MKLFFIIALLGNLFPNNALCQKNKVEIQVAPIHTFFYDTPLIAEKTASNTLTNRINKRIHESWHLKYSFSLNAKSNLSFDFALFVTEYKTQFYFLDVIDPQISFQKWITFGLCYSRFKPINDKLSYNYGVGFNYRKGIESIDLKRISIGPVENGINEIISYTGYKKDFGANIFLGLYHQIAKSMFVTTKLNFLTFFYVSDKDYIQAMKSDYYNSPQFPSRFDLSLNFGLGFNF